MLLSRRFPAVSGGRKPYVHAPHLLEPANEQQEDGTDTLPGQLDTSCYRGMDHEQSLGAANRALAHPSKHRKKTNSGRIAQSFKGSPWVTAGPNGFKRPARYMVPKSYREWRFETW